VDGNFYSGGGRSINFRLKSLLKKSVKLINVNATDYSLPHAEKQIFFTADWRQPKQISRAKTRRARKMKKEI
jgi:hypothetical protein